MPHTYTWDKLTKNATRLNPKSRGNKYPHTPRFEKLAIIPFVGTKTCLVKLQAWGVTQNNMHQVTLLFGDCDIKQGEQENISLWEYFKIEYKGKVYYVKKFDRLRNPLTSRCTCFTGDTTILLADGTSKTFKELEGQEFEVIAYNEQNQCFEKVKAFNCECKGISKTIKITLDDGKIIKCTPDHKILTESGNWIEAKDLRKGTYLCSIFSNKEDITKLEIHPPANPYYLYQLTDKEPIYFGKSKTKDVNPKLIKETLGYNPSIETQNTLLEEWVADRFRKELSEQYHTLNQPIDLKVNPCVQKLNYKVVNIEEDIEQEVYCLTTEYLGNFVVSFDKEDITSGIVVSNCKDYFYTFAWYNYYNAHCLYGPAPRPYRKKTNRPPRNAMGIPGICKHLYNAWQYLRSEGLTIN